MPTATQPQHIQRLDVEDQVQREARLSQLLQRINDSTHADTDNSRISPSTSASPFVDAAPGPSSSPLSTLFDSGVRETHPVEPPSELLSRVESFLPQMEAANVELAHRMEVSPESVNIENLEGGTDEEDEEHDDGEDDENGRQYIEMVREWSAAANRILQDIRTPANALYSHCALYYSSAFNLGLGVFDIRRRPDSDSGSNSNSSSSSDSHSSEGHSDSDSDASTSVPPASRPIRPLPKEGPAKYRRPQRVNKRSSR